MKYSVSCNTLAMALLVLLGCAHKPGTVGPHLSDAEVIHIAEAMAFKNGVILGNYQQPELTFVMAERSWDVMYLGKERRPGNHFLVVVYEATGKAQYIPGY